MSDDHDEGWQARSTFRQIQDHDLVGTVDGIEFDFSGGGFMEPAHWRMATSLDWTGLTFPWDSAFNGTATHMADPSDVTSSGAFTDLFGALAKIQRVRVYPGDKVIAKEIAGYRRGGNERLRDHHDNTDYSVTLMVIRADGSEIVRDERVGFVARDAMGPHSDYSGRERDSDYAEWVRDFHVDFEKIAHRIERLHVEDHMKGEWMMLAHDMLGEVRDRLADSEFDKWSVGELVDIAATAGYALAKAEAEAKLEPLAKAQLKTEAQRVRAAKVAADKRRKPDTPELLNAAKAMCKVDANLSLNRCATELAARFGRDAANVRPMIRHLFERRKLPGGRPEYRPRRQGESGGSTGSSGG